MDFENMEPIFGQLKAVEWSVGGGGGHGSLPLKPFLYLVQASPNDHSPLRILVTDFHSNTWEALKSTSQLEDMRDSIGIGGSWSDFIEYVVESLKSEDVKLVMEGQSKSGGANHAKLIAQKSKGMPRISISLAKRVDAAGNVAIADFSLALYGAYINVRTSLINEEQRRCQLTKDIATEQDKNETLRQQLGTMLCTKKQRLENVNENAVLGGVSGLSSQVSPDKQAMQKQASTKVATRVVPAYRRTKVRGALLKDTEDDTQD